MQRSHYITAGRALRPVKRRCGGTLIVAPQRRLPADCWTARVELLLLQRLWAVLGGRGGGELE